MATPAHTAAPAQTIAWAIDQLKFLVSTLLADDRATRIVDRALQDLEAHRQVVTWNAYAAAKTAASRRQTLKRRHQARRVPA